MYLKYYLFLIFLWLVKFSDFYLFLDNVFVINLERSGYVDFNFIFWKWCLIMFDLYYNVMYLWLFYIEKLKLWNLLLSFIDK